MQPYSVREDAWKKATYKGEALIHAVSFLSLQRWTNAREGREAEDFTCSGFCISACQDFAQSTTAALSISCGLKGWAASGFQFRAVPCTVYWYLVDSNRWKLWICDAFVLPFMWLSIWWRCWTRIWAGFSCRCFQFQSWYRATTGRCWWSRGRSRVKA